MNRRREKEETADDGERERERGKEEGARRVWLAERREGEKDPISFLILSFYGSENCEGLASRRC